MAGCYGDATHDYSVCLYEHAFFTPEMCPGAADAKAVCDAAFDSCSAIPTRLKIHKKRRHWQRNVGTPITRVSLRAVTGSASRNLANTTRWLG
jgi:hypothetical protein